MARTDRYNAQQVADALIDNYGFIYKTAKQLRCSAQTIYNYINKYKVCKEAKETADGYLDDLTESKLMKLIEKGDHWAIGLRLARSKRGYQVNKKESSQTEVELENTGEVKRIIIKSEKPIEDAE